MLWEERRGQDWLTSLKTEESEICEAPVGCVSASTALSGKLECCGLKADVYEIIELKLKSQQQKVCGDERKKKCLHVYCSRQTPFKKTTTTSASLFVTNNSVIQSAPPVPGEGFYRRDLLEFQTEAVST